MYISSRAACVYPLQVVVLWGTLLNTLHGIQQCRSFISTRQVQKQEKVAVMQLVLPYFSKYCIVRLKVFHFQDQMHAGWYRHRKPGLGNNLEGWDGEGGGKDGERCSRGRGHR